jgi:hypothetical protein
MGKAQTRHQVLEVGDVIRHRRRQHVRRKIISFQEGLPWTFRLDAQERFMKGNSMLITRIEEWELADGEA